MSTCMSSAASFTLSWLAEDFLAPTLHGSYPSNSNVEYVHLIIKQAKHCNAPSLNPLLDYGPGVSWPPPANPETQLKSQHRE